MQFYTHQLSLLSKLSTLAALSKQKCVETRYETFETLYGFHLSIHLWNICINIVDEAERILAIKQEKCTARQQTAIKLHSVKDCLFAFRHKSQYIHIHGYVRTKQAYSVIKTCKSKLAKAYTCAWTAVTTGFQYTVQALVSSHIE